MEEERDKLDIYMVELVATIFEDRQGVINNKFRRKEFTERWIPGKLGVH